MHDFSKYLVFTVSIVSLMFMYLPPAFSNGLIKLDDEPYIAFFKNHGKELHSKYTLPNEGHFSFWGTDRNTYIYKTTDDAGNYKPPYWTKGDFNFDGVVDRAYILFERATDKASVFVFVSSRETYDIIRLASASEADGICTYIQETEKTVKYLLKHLTFDSHAIVYKWGYEEKKFVISE